MGAKFDKIRENITSMIPFTSDDWDSIQNIIETAEISKNDFFLKENTICDSVAFVESGLFVYYTTLSNGNEITIDFAFAGDWITNIHSRLSATPSHLNIKAIRKSKLFIIKHRDLEMLYEKLPLFERFSRLLTEQAYVKLVQHSIDLQTLSATDRYLKLLQRQPELVRQIQVYHIANYLGVAPKSLSRIRNHIFYDK